MRVIQGHTCRVEGCENERGWAVRECREHYDGNVESVSWPRTRNEFETRVNPDNPNHVAITKVGDWVAYNHEELIEVVRSRYFEPDDVLTIGVGPGPGWYWVRREGGE